MWKNKHKKLSKRVLSALAASAIAGSQIMTAIPYSTAAARTSKQINTVPDKVMWWGDETDASNYGDVNPDESIADITAAAGEAYDTQGLDPSKSPVKPILSLSRLRVPISEVRKNPDQTIELKVSGADGKYSATGLNIQYDARLTIKKDGDNYAEKGDACKDLTVVQKSTGNGFYFGTVSSEDKGRDGTYMTFKLTVPADTKVGDKFPIEIAYYSDESRKGSFTNAKKDENGQLMEAWVFTQGVQQGYIEVVNDEVTTSTTSTTSTTTTSTTSTTSTTTTSTTSTTSTTTTSTTSTTSTTATTTTTTPISLPDRKKYEVIKTAMTWDEADSYCRSVNGHLATLTSFEEQELITNLLKEEGLSECWLGGKRDENGEFGWITGEPMVFTNWNGGEPNNLGGHEDYIHTYSSGKWNDLPGDHRKFFICEWGIASERPADLEEKPTRLNIDGELKVTPMTKQQVIDAGIDLGDDDNFNSFQYSIEADFDTAGVVIEKIVTFDQSGAPVYNQAAINVAGCTSVIINPGIPTYVPGIGAYVVRTVTTETVDEEMYMIIYGKSKWLKEFYDVQLIVVNNDTKTLTDCSAKLNIPDGLTLCKGDETQDFGDLKPNEIKTADWYLRGDKEGDYELTADFCGKNKGEEFDYQFKSKDALHVYAGSALKMIVELPRYSYFDEMYNIKIKLENVSDKPIYDLENVITRFQQGSDATLYRSYGNGALRPVADKHMDLVDVSDVARINVDELAPGESAVIELNVKDLWKSVYEQYIGANTRRAHCYRILNAGSSRPDLRMFSWFNSMYEELLGELPVEHILRDNVSVNFVGSDMTVPYEVKIIENGDPTFGMLHVVTTPGAYTTLRNAFYRDRYDPRAVYTTYRNNYLIGPFSMVVSTNHSTNHSTSSGGHSGPVYYRTWPVIFTVTPPSPEVTATVYVEEASGARRQPAPSEDGSAAVTAESGKAFALEEMTGVEPDADGKITVTGETAFMITANETGRRGILHIEYSDGTKEEREIISGEEHECTSSKGFELVAEPKNGEAGLAVKLCDICGDAFDSISINPQATAMLSNGKTYADIRVAVEDAVKAGEKTELSIFGNVNVTADVTIPDYVDVLIAKDTAITVREGFKLIAKGNVRDLSGFDYDLSGNGPVVPATTTVTTTTNATTTTTASDSIYPDAKMCYWVVKDYQKRTGASDVNAEITASSDNEKTITLTDKNGKVLDVYTIDPASGSGKNSAGEAVELPQTGMDTLPNYFAVIGSLVLMILGAFAVKFSRRRDDEN